MFHHKISYNSKTSKKLNCDFSYS